LRFAVGEECLHQIKIRLELRTQSRVLTDRNFDVVIQRLVRCDRLSNRNGFARQIIHGYRGRIPSSFQCYKYGIDVACGKTSTPIGERYLEGIESNVAVGIVGDIPTEDRQEITGLHLFPLAGLILVINGQLGLHGRIQRNDVG